MKGIVVGVDDSTSARAALRWALHYATATGQPLTVVTVIEPLLLNVEWSNDPLDNEHLVAAARDDCRELLAKAVAGSGRPLEVAADYEVLVGHPVEKLVAASADADLLVVGSRGAGGFSRLLLGSVSSGVVHHAPCNVTVVRDARTQ